MLESDREWLQFLQRAGGAQEETMAILTEIDQLRERAGEKQRNYADQEHFCLAVSCALQAVRERLSLSSVIAEQLGQHEMGAPLWKLLIAATTDAIVALETASPRIQSLCKEFTAAVRSAIVTESPS